MNDPALHDKIEAYLTGRMPAGEAQAFSERMAADQALAKEVALHKLEHDAMNLLLEKDLKKKMDWWDEAPPPNPFGKDQGSSNTWKIGLPIFFVLVLGLWSSYQFLRPNDDVAPPAEKPSTSQPLQPDNPAPVGQPENEAPANEQPVATTPNNGENIEKEQKEKPRKQLPGSETTGTYLAMASAAYQRPPQMGSTLKSGENPGEKTTFQQAADYFYQGDFEASETLLGPPSSADQGQVRYLRGHAYFNQKKFNAAQVEFEAVANARFSPYKQDAKWYLLLTYLAQMPATKANFDELAAQLANEQNQYGRMKEVQRLLLQLEKK